MTARVRRGVEMSKNGKEWGSRLPWLLLTLAMAVAPVMACSGSSVEELIQQADSLSSEGKQEEALRVLQEALTRFPESSQAHLELAKLHSAREEYADAVEHYQQAVELEPDNLEAHLNFAGYYYKRKNYPASLRHLEEVVRRSPQSSEAQMAKSLYRDVEMDFALSEVRNRVESVLRQPDLQAQKSQELRSLLADSYVREGTQLLRDRNPAAVEAFQQAVSLAPEVSRHHQGLAEAWALNGDSQKAAQALEKALELAPDDPAILLPLAGTYTQLEENARAIELLERLIDRHPYTVEAELGRRRLEELERGADGTTDTLPSQ